MPKPDISRRAVLLAGIGAAGAGAIAAGGYGLVEAGTLPGKYRLARLLGACGSGPPAPRGPRPARQEAQFRSAYRRQLVRVVTLIPAGASPRAGLGVVVALHGLGGDAESMASRMAPAMVAAGTRGLAVLTVDGGSTYWHRRADGDDPQGMIIHEVLPRAAALGLRTDRIGVIGYSMGGYGALLLAERLGGACAAAAGRLPRAAAVAALSPAIFASYPDARRADPRAFDSPADFAANNVLTGDGALRQVPALIACGQEDPFQPMTVALRSRLLGLTGHPPAGQIGAGCHDIAFWARNLPGGLQFIAGHLS